MERNISLRKSSDEYHFSGQHSKNYHIKNSTTISINLKSTVFDTCTLPVDMYMERAIIGDYLRYKIINKYIRKITQVTEINEIVAELKWRWTRHIVRHKDERWTSKVQSPLRETKRGRLQLWWVDDMKQATGNSFDIRRLIIDGNGRNWSCSTTIPLPYLILSP